MRPLTPPRNSILKHSAWLAALLALAAAVILLAGNAEAQTPPTPPAPVLPTGELGNPTGLQAAPGDYRGEVNLTWSPAANATINWVYRVQSNGLGGLFLPAAGLNPGTRTVTDLAPAQSYWFIVIAGQRQSDGSTRWSQWSNWAQAAPPAQPIRPPDDPPPLPDLIVENARVSKTNLNVGESFSLSFTVRNRGNAGSRASHLLYYLSDNAVIDRGNDREVSTLDGVPALSASASRNYSRELTAPATPGEHYYGVCVERQDESDWSNNCSAGARIVVAASPPDLIVESPTVSSSVVDEGASFSLTVTVSNGGSATTESTRLTYYRSNNSQITGSGDDSAVGSATVEPLRAAESNDYRLEITAPQEPGRYYYGACAATVTGERNRNNNCSDGVLVTVPAPDLIVEDVTVSENSVPVGASFSIRATVNNQGSARAAQTELTFHRSPNSTITSDDTKVLSNITIPALDESDSRSYTRETNAPGAIGIYYYGACVQPVQRERNQDNNCSAGVRVAVIRGDPDLEITSFTVSRNTTVVGSTRAIILSGSVTNIGGAPAPATPLRYYSSTDSTISASDTEIGQQQIRQLARSERSSFRRETPVPAAAGVYYYGVCVAPAAGEIEQRNNCSAGQRVRVQSVTAACLRTLDSRPGSRLPNTTDLTATGRWDGDCQSENRTGSYARFYTFTLTEAVDEITITLSSSDNIDTYLYLLRGKGISGTVITQQDDGPIEMPLAAGTYTVEATTFNEHEEGEFTLTVSSPPRDDGNGGNNGNPPNVGEGETN